jgi:hypothetical protein
MKYDIILFSTEATAAGSLKLGKDVFLFIESMLIYSFHVHTVN